MSGVGCLKYLGALELDVCSAAEVDVGGRVEPDARVAVLVVVPLEEALAERTSIFNGAESSRELWAVFERLELRL